MSRDVTLQHVTYVSAHFSVLVFPQGHSSTGPCKPIHSTKGKHFLASTQDSGPSSGIRTPRESCEGQVYSSTKDSEHTGTVVGSQHSLYGSGPGSLRLHPGLLCPSPIV